MTVLTVGNKGGSTSYLCHRLHANFYQFKKAVYLDKLTIASTGPSMYPARAIILRYSDVSALATSNTSFDARSYAILTSNETNVTVNGETTFTFPKTLVLQPNVTYIIGVSFDGEDANGSNIYYNTDLSHTTDVTLNADVMLKAEATNNGTILNHGTNYYKNGGSTSLYGWANQTFWQKLDYSDATSNPAGTYTFPNIPARLQVGDVINFPYTGAAQLLNRPEIGKVRVDLYGAQGGSAAENSPGGYGGRSIADFYVRGKALYVNVGGTPGRSYTGGWNGGGTCSQSVGGGGGGATDVRLNGNALSDRVVVAGGGGGGGYENASWTSGGGHGGGANRPGINGAKGMAEGGQLTRGGNLGGILGQGATYGQNGASYPGNQNGNGGGGGGYYGGGMASSNSEDYGGGGGSGYADTTKCTNISGTDGGNYNTSGGGTGWSGNGKATITILELNANPPNTPPNIVGPPIELNFNESIDLAWTGVGIPVQPVGTTLDVNKVFYETLFYPTGAGNGLVMETSLEKLTTRIRPIIGNLNGARFGVRAYVLVSGIKIYSDPIRTQAFKVAPAPINARYPNALTFDGVNDYVEINQRVIPPTGDFTIEGFFKTTAKKQATIFHLTSTLGVMGFRLNINANGSLSFVDKSGSSIGGHSGLNDGKLHQYVIMRQNSVLKIYIDGQRFGSDIPSAPSYVDNDLIILADSSDRSSKFEGVLGLPRFWNDIRTLEELDTFKNSIVPDNEQGLIDYVNFNPTTGAIGLKKGTTTATMYNGTRWSYMFNALTDIVLPYPDDFQRSENLDYIRVKVNELRSYNGLPDVKWTDPFLIKGYTPIRATHWNEVEDSILEVFDTIGQKINSQAVEDQFRQDIKPNDTQFPIKQLRQRINNIVKGLKND